MASILGRLSTVTVSIQGRPSHFACHVGRQLVGAERQIADHARAVDDQSDIGRGGDQGRGSLGVEVAQRLFWVVKVRHKRL